MNMVKYGMPWFTESECEFFKTIFNPKKWFAKEYPEKVGNANGVNA